MFNNTIREVGAREAALIIENRMPIGKFYLQSPEGIIAIDNSTEDAWTEDFKTKEEAIAWLESSRYSSWSPSEGYSK